MQVYKNKSHCSGCGVCSNVCPKKAITMVKDVKGFLYPKVNNEKCIGCNLCKKVCPIMNKSNKNKQINIYACKNKNYDKRITSSSGAVFEELASYILENNGVVFGAIFDENFKVIHKKATNHLELEKLKKSKYVQSDTKEIYNEVKQELNNGKLVLFSGTPCQIQAIKNMNLKNSNNLFLIDIVCHGVPSPGVFEDYKEYMQNKYNSKITNINFRYKVDDKIQKIKIDFKSKETYISSFTEGDYFYKLFLKDLILRDSCYNCQYKNIERASDISLADFWGIEKGSLSHFKDGKGISLVLINTKKGEELFNNIVDKFEIVKVKEEECIPFNCFSNFEKPIESDEIWKDYIEGGFNKIIEENKF